MEKIRERKQQYCGKKDTNQIKLYNYMELWTVCKNTYSTLGLHKLKCIIYEILRHRVYTTRSPLEESTMVARDSTYDSHGRSHRRTVTDPVEKIQ